MMTMSQLCIVCHVISNKILSGPIQRERERETTDCDDEEAVSEEVADSDNVDCDEVDCSIANGVGNIDDKRQPVFTDGPVADTELSNSLVVEDTTLAVSNKDKEVIDLDRGFWNLSEVGFFNEKDVEAIQLVVEINPSNAVKDFGKGKRKKKRIEDKLGFPKSKKKGCCKQKNA